MTPAALGRRRRHAGYMSTHAGYMSTHAGRPTQAKEVQGAISTLKHRSSSPAALPAPQVRIAPVRPTHRPGWGSRSHPELSSLHRLAPVSMAVVWPVQFLPVSASGKSPADSADASCAGLQRQVKVRQTPLIRFMASSALSAYAANAVATSQLIEGNQLSKLIEALPLSRGSVFELLKALGIQTTKGPGPGGRGRVAWLSIGDSERLFSAAHRVHRGEVRISDLAAAGGGGGGLATRQTAKAGPTADSADSSDPAPFLARLEAAQLATSSGLGLTTAEVHWILGVIPGTSPLTRAGITATRTGKNCWKLDRA